MINQKYPLVWSKDDFFIKIFCSIPNIATGILIKADDMNIVVDPGDGILRDLNVEIGAKNIINISHIFISHGHHDHLGGLWSLFTYLKVMNKKDTLNLYFPEGCKEIKTIYDAFKKVYGKSITFDVNLNGISEFHSIKVKKVSVKPFPVVHKEHSESKESVPSLGFNFTYGQKKICYGGDTAFCETLAKNVKNADLAIIEAGNKEAEADGIHMTINEAMNLGKTAKEYFLVHMPKN
ncbi:MAG TPA: MBL fold metallo-hydrolase [Ignavibacteriaceae bacterium]|nr:MBL fold metallo-hydrolase [Ignavibacteriaceae bacterium]